MRHLVPFLVLFVLPAVIGIASEFWLRDARRATLVATLGSIVAVYVCLQAGDPGGTWNWLAALLVLPLPIALSLAAVFICHGRAQGRRRHVRYGR